jgi:hypothetical protein
MEKNKLKSVELFIEYKKAHQIKMDIVTGIVNCKLIDYFTEDKKNIYKIY